jgi:hypothetical protein
MSWHQTKHTSSFTSWQSLSIYQDSGFVEGKRAPSLFPQPVQACALRSSGDWSFNLLAAPFPNNSIPRPRVTPKPHRFVMGRQVRKGPYSSLVS